VPSGSRIGSRGALDEFLTVFEVAVLSGTFVGRGEILVAG
jgi:hypothetical protein